MKTSCNLAGALCAAALTLLATTPATAEEPGISTVTPAVAPAPVDRDGKPVYGFELMSESEINGLCALLFGIKDPVAREEARAEHRKAMNKRAAERGVKIRE